MSSIQTLIHDVRMACDDVMRIELDYPVRLPAYEPGSHIVVEVEIQGRRENRSYSVVERLSDHRLVIAVRRLDGGRGGSQFIHKRNAGDRQLASLPASHFTLGFSAPFVALLAGGIGITPLIGMARALRRKQVPFRLTYLGRSSRSMPFLAELKAEFGDAFVAWIDDEDGAFDVAGMISRIPAGSELYMCGPGPMMAAARVLWRQSGRSLDLLRFETFGAIVEGNPEPFRVRVPALNLDLPVPHNRSLLDVLDDAGAEPLFSCRRGECGLCVVEILSLEGAVDHRDVFFSQRQRDEETQLCACVSRVTGCVTIEMP